MAIRTVSLTQPRLLTMEDWVRHPSADLYELIDGVLRPRMVNQNQHEFAVGRLSQILNNGLDDLKLDGALFTSNTKYQVRARRGIMPDLSIVLGAKVAQMSPRAAYNKIGPDLAVEILSPEQDEEYIEERLGDYQKIGTTEVWFVDPNGKTVTGYTRGERGYTPFAVARGDETFSSQLLPGLSFTTRSLWMPGR